MLACVAFRYVDLCSAGKSILEKEGGSFTFPYSCASVCCSVRNEGEQVFVCVLTGCLVGLVGVSGCLKISAPVFEIHVSK